MNDIIPRFTLYPRVRVAHRREQTHTGVVISRRSRARAVVAIQTPFFAIYDNTYAVGRIMTRAGGVCVLDLFNRP